MADIFDLRERAIREGLANRTGTEGVPALLDAILRPRDAEQTQVCSECENILTITDVGRVCRQCRLEWPRRGSVVV